MKPAISTKDYSNILQLPKDKGALEYIKKKFGENSTSEKLEVITELFEMHRTSTGFDPMSLSKGRFKRIKSIAFKQILFEINSGLPDIVNSPGYKEHLQKQNRSRIIYDKMKLVKEKLEKVDFKNMEKEIDELREQIAISKSKDLMVALANLFSPLHKEKKFFG